MKRDEETRAERDKRLELESLGRHCADDITRTLSLHGARGCGFAVVVFDFGDVGNMAYASNANRDDVVKMLRDLVSKIERQ